MTPKHIPWYLRPLRLIWWLITGERHWCVGCRWFEKKEPKEPFSASDRCLAQIRSSYGSSQSKPNCADPLIANLRGLCTLWQPKDPTRSSSEPDHPWSHHPRCRHIVGGYQPDGDTRRLDENNPPRGGSGVPRSPFGPCSGL
jgi:hypothetical protein